MTLGTQCGNIQKGVQIKNGSTVQIPLQCTAIAEGAFFIRAVDLYKEAKHDLESNMLDRETMQPLFPVFVHENDVEKSINETIKIWNDISAEKIRVLHVEHGKKHDETWMYTTAVTGGIILIVFIITFVVVTNQIRECKRRRRARRTPRSTKSAR